MAQTFNRYRDIIPDYEGFLTALEQPLPVAIRVNTLCPSGKPA
jgi:hypothetical protein